MTNTFQQPEENFPVFELGYFDSLTGGPNRVRSRQGKIFLRLANGRPFHWITLSIVSSIMPLKLKYKCMYKGNNSEDDRMAEAFEGAQCPQENASYIKKIAFESKIYYRCWLSRDRSRDEFERDPAGAFWYPSGQFCGTDEDSRWITALEIKMPSLVGNWLEPLDRRDR